MNEPYIFHLKEYPGRSYRKGIKYAAGAGAVWFLLIGLGQCSYVRQKMKPYLEGVFHDSPCVRYHRMNANKNNFYHSINVNLKKSEKKNNDIEDKISK